MIMPPETDHLYLKINIPPLAHEWLVSLVSKFVNREGAIWEKTIDDNFKEKKRIAGANN